MIKGYACLIFVRESQNQKRKKQVTNERESIDHSNDSEDAIHRRYCHSVAV